MHPSKCSQSGDVQKVSPFTGPQRHLLWFWDNDSFVDLIHPHWLQFEQASETFHVVSGMVTLLIGVAAFCGNSFVIFIFRRTKRLKSRSNTLVVNLAVSDLLMTSILSPMYAASSFKSHWVFGYFGCQLYGFAGSLCGTASIITITAMALDRCFVICKPYGLIKDLITARRSNLSLLIIWTYSLIWAVIPLTPWFPPYVPEGLLTTCSFNLLDAGYNNRFYVAAMCVGAYLAPLIIIFTAYFRIIAAVVIRRNLLSTLYAGRSPSFTIGKRQEMQQAKSAKTSFFVVAGWTMAWTPYAVVSILAVCGAYDYITPMACHLPAIFAKTAAVYNPIIYALNSARYRQAFARIFNNFPTYEACGPDLLQRESTIHSVTTVRNRAAMLNVRMASVPNLRRRHPPVTRVATFPLAGSSQYERQLTCDSTL